MTENIESKWFLHSIEGDSYYFRRIDMPYTDMEGFTLTYIKPGYGVLTGDMGSLVWQRHESGFDYGFPYKDTGIDYFAEKVCKAEHQQTQTWDWELAIKEIRQHFKEYYNDDENYDYKEVLKDLDDMFECSFWGDCDSHVGEYKMYEELYDRFPDDDWCECDFGKTWEYHFKRKFEMVKSVSKIIIEAVNIKET